MMLSNTKQADILNGHARPFFARSTELLNFQNRLGLGPRDDFTVLTLKGFYGVSLMFSEMMHSAMEQIAI